MENSTSQNFIMLLSIIFFWYCIFKIFYNQYKRQKLEEDYKKSIIETEKHLRKIAENSEKNSNQ